MLVSGTGQAKKVSQKISANVKTYKLPSRMAPNTQVNA